MDKKAFMDYIMSKKKGGKKAEVKPESKASGLKKKLAKVCSHCKGKGCKACKK
jgi:hypothetical protein